MGEFLWNVAITLSPRDEPQLYNVKTNTRRRSGGQRREGFASIRTSEDPLIRPVGHLLPLPGGEGIWGNTVAMIQSTDRIGMTFEAALAPQCK